MLRPRVAVLVLALSSCVAACARDERPPALVDARRSHDASPVSVATSPRPAPVIGTAEGDEARVACRYEIVTTSAALAAPQRSEWTLRREPDRIETKESRGETGEVWRRDAKGRVASFERVFHRERRIIEYTAGDLSALGVATQWERLETVIDAKQLGREFVRTGSASVAGRDAETYELRTPDAFVSLTWLPGARLPAEVVRTRGGETVRLTLLEMQPVESAPWSRSDISDYRATDYSDIGDSPADPFLRGLALSGHTGRAHGD